MSGSQYREDSYVKCPYYRKEAPIELKCAGLCGDHTVSTFKNKKAKNLYKEDFCCGYYWNCPLYRGLEQDGK